MGGPVHGEAWIVMAARGVDENAAVDVGGK
jgi:hypothetical protein